MNSQSTSTSLEKVPSRRCHFLHCIKTAKSGGFCISHGGGKKCAVEGCRTSVVSRGYCVAHGGGKRCQYGGCTKSAQTGGFCWIHGGGKTCHHPLCTKRAQSGGACIAHGGGKRCRTEGCTKVVQYDGRCVSHGGFRTCIRDGCDLKAFPNGCCARHGGQADCQLKTCSRKALRGGLCRFHRDQHHPMPSIVEHSSPVAIETVTAQPSSSTRVYPHSVQIENMTQIRPPESTTLSFTSSRPLPKQYITSFRPIDLGSQKSVHQSLQPSHPPLHPLWRTSLVQDSESNMVHSCVYPNCLRFAKVNHKCLLHQT